jgi:hypothetical protein
LEQSSVPGLETLSVVLLVTELVKWLELLSERQLVTMSVAGLELDLAMPWD